MRLDKTVLADLNEQQQQQVQHYAAALEKTSTLGPELQKEAVERYAAGLRDGSLHGPRPRATRRRKH